MNMENKKCTLYSEFLVEMEIYVYTKKKSRENFTKNFQTNNFCIQYLSVDVINSMLMLYATILLFQFLYSNKDFLPQ